MRSRRTTSQPRVCIIGLDGATLDLVKPWVEAGKLPTFKRFLTDGAHGELTSTVPPVTAPSWTSLMTGKNPGKHGLYHFVEPQPDSYELRYTNARSRLAKTVWQILSESGVSVGVVNVPMTYPPEPVQGYMISGLDAPDDSKAITYPPALYQELEAKFGKVSQQIRYLGYLKTDERRDALLQSLEEMNDHYLAMMQYLLQRYPVDVNMIVFTATDTVQHFFWQYMDPQHPQYDPVGARKYSGAILKVYQKIDDLIGKLTASLSEDTAVILMSDHGAQATSARELRLNRFLAELGLLHFRGTKRAWYHPRALLQTGIKRLDGLLRGTLSPQHKARLARALPRLRKQWEARYTGLTSIDWQRTKAYGYEVLTFPSGVWINVQGQRPQGTVSPGAEYEQLLQFLSEKLLELQDPATGQQIVQRVYRKEELYHGPYLAQAPDLTLEWWNGITFVGKPSFTTGEAEAVVKYVGGAAIVGGEWGGGHALEGMLVMRGGPFQANKQLRNARIIDLAPTLLYLLGQPIPADMDGRVLCEAFQDDFVATHAITTLSESAEPAQEQGTRDSTYSDEEARQMAERLRNLGYIE